MIGDNIKKLRENLGFTQAKFAAQIGITQSAIAGVETGKTKISRQALLAISREFGVRLEWLETGEGEMYAERDLSMFAQLEAEGVLTPKGREFLEAFLKLPAHMQNIVVDAVRVASVLYPRKPDSELTPDEAAETIRQERAAELSAQKRGTLTSSVSTGLNGTSKRFGNTS